MPAPGTSALDKFEKLYSAAYKTTEGKFFIANTYDAVMLVALAIEQAGSTDRTKIRDALRNVCCAPGDVIEPGEWAKAKADIAAGNEDQLRRRFGLARVRRERRRHRLHRRISSSRTAPIKEVGLVTP